jgi:hypothetical protein
MENFDTLKNLKHLQYWFDTINSFEGHASRVAGDKYSWTGTNKDVANPYTLICCSYSG